LPFLEQKPLFDQYSYLNIANSSKGDTYSLTFGPDPTGNKNRIVGSTPLKVMTCASDQNPAPVMITGNAAQTFYERGVNGRFPGVARGNYLFSTGYYTDYDRDYSVTAIWAKGAFGNNGAAALNMRDGTSSTIAIGEATQDYHDQADGPYPLAGVHTAVHGRILHCTRNFSDCQSGYVASGGTSLAQCVGYCSINAPNRRLINGITDYTGNWQYAWGFGSRHPGGAQFVMCDGAVRFLTNQTDYIRVLMPLSTPEGTEVVGNN
jgi:prepilin-type processing-associated H-X9-DG protein